MPMGEKYNMPFVNIKYEMSQTQDSFDMLS